MKLSDLDASQVTAAPSTGLKLSDLHPDDVISADETPLPASEAAGMISSIPFAPQVGAAGKTAMDVLTGGTDVGDALSQYRRERDSLQSDLANKVAAHPLVALAGSLPAMGALPLGANAESMAAYGAASGLSNSKADLTKGEVGPALDDALRGGAVAGVLGGAAETASPLLEKAYSKLSAPVANYLKELAEKKAVQATGATGIQAAKFAPGTGRELLDRGIVSFGSTPADIAASSQAAMDRSGQGIADSLKALDAQGVTVDRRKIIDALNAKIEELSGNEGETAVVDQLKKKVADIQAQIPENTTQVTGFRPADKPVELTPATFENDAMLADPNTKKPARYLFGNSEDQWAKLRGVETSPAVSMTPIEPKFGEVPGNSEIPIGKSEDIKRSFDRNSKWSSNSDAATLEANRTAANAYRAGSEDAATAANPALADQFKADKESYSLLSPVQEQAQKRALQLQQSPHGGLLDITAAGAGGGIGAAMGGPIGAAVGTVGGLAAKAARPRYASMAAVGSDWLGDTIRTAPQSLGKWAPSLTAAAARGGNAVGATDYLLQQTDPAYREHIMGLKNASQEVADQQGNQ